MNVIYEYLTNSYFVAGYVVAFVVFYIDIVVSKYIRSYLARRALLREAKKLYLENFIKDVEHQKACDFKEWIRNAEAGLI